MSIYLENNEKNGVWVDKDSEAHEFFKKDGYTEKKTPTTTTTVKKSGEPFATEAAANAAATKAGYTSETHEILPVEGGYLVSEIKAK